MLLSQHRLVRLDNALPRLSRLIKDGRIGQISLLSRVSQSSESMISAGEMLMPADNFL
jgi:hypothetical protein